MKQRGIDPKSTRRWQKTFDKAMKERTLKIKPI